MEPDSGVPVFPSCTILVLDDDEGIRTRLELLFARVGLDHVIATGDKDLAYALVAGREVELVILDLFLPEAVGEDLLREFSRAAPELPVIVMTSDASPEMIVRCMRAGAVDYVVKPIDEVRLCVSVWNAIASVEQRRLAEGFRDKIFEHSRDRPEAFRSIVTQDERMLALFSYGESVARSRQPVLITGETGTGKELFARAIHEASGRTGKFVAVNVGGLDDAMFSDCLFGHKKGAYTGADTARQGLLKEAEGGTILLDEVGDLEPHSQIKLLRLLQEGDYYPLGSDLSLRSDARVVAATTKDLRGSSASGGFRSDLFYRLQTHPIALPPLRERPGDILLLARHFLEKSACELGIAFPGDKEAKLCAEKVTRVLQGYQFPGNVRELESLVHDAVTGARGGELDLEALKRRIGAGQEPAQDGEETAQVEGLPPFFRAIVKGAIPTMNEAERELAELALERSDGNMSRAAQILGISRQTLYNKLKKETQT
jgi:Response regulator containing CheY-like receiver, AAA-type ATPase, and DNA-binding domains